MKIIDFMLISLFWFKIDNIKALEQIWNGLEVHILKNE